MPSAFFKVVIQEHPDGGHTGREGDLFLGNGLAELLHVDHLAARKHLLAAGPHRGEWPAPGIGMEHGHDMQGAVRLAGAEGNGHGIGVEDDGPVRIHNPLGVACSGRGIADHGRVPLGEIHREVILFGELGDELIVHDEVLYARYRLLSGVREHHDVLDGLELVFDHLHEHEQVLIHEDDLVFGMIDDVDEMIHGQPEINRVKDRPGARNSEVELQVPVVVECNTCHPVAALDTQRF